MIYVWGTFIFEFVFYFTVWSSVLGLILVNCKVISCRTMGIADTAIFLSLRRFGE